jgi:hypothetical protein|tara:strand:+ start:29 stop:460 length:432 start_codon:yes stop_codon:yes gene_type:complete
MDTALKPHLLYPDDVPYVWEDVAPMLAKAAVHSEGELEPEDFLEPLSTGEMQLWVAYEDNDRINAAMVTQFIQYPQKKILRIISLAGEDFKKIKNFQAMIEGFAIKHGCTAIELWGRKGWKKLLPDWRDAYTVYTKELQHRLH